MWQKGQAPNPTGKGGKFQEARSICREASPEAARKLVELIDDPDPKIAGWASEKVLERAWGKPKEYDPEDEGHQAMPLDPSALSPDQRQRFMQLLRLLLSAAESAPVEPEVVLQSDAVETNASDINTIEPK